MCGFGSRDVEVTFQCHVAAPADLEIINPPMQCIDVKNGCVPVRENNQCSHQHCHISRADLQMKTETVSQKTVRPDRSPFHYLLHHIRGWIVSM